MPNEVWNPWEDHEKIWQKYEEHCEQLIKKGSMKLVSPEEIGGAEQKRIKALEELSKVSNKIEWENWQKNIFMPAHKELIKACGLKPCAAEDCTDIVIVKGRRKKDYCSEKCRRRQSTRRWRRKNPEKKERANLKYLKDIYPDDNK